jgi:fatty-acyl-CoA synthase
MTTTQEGLPIVATTQDERRWSYTSGTSETPLLGLTIGDMFDRTVAMYPDRPALIVRQQGLRLSYRELQAEVNRCAK